MTRLYPTPTVDEGKAENHNSKKPVSEIDFGFCFNSKE